MDDDNTQRGPVPSGALAARRLIIICLLAMLAGYFFSDTIRGFFRDDSGVEHDFEVMRTYARITIPKGEGDGTLTPAELAAEAQKAVEEINELMGPVGERSDVRRLNTQPAGTCTELDPLTWHVLMESLRWHRLSGGAFDPTIGPVKKLFTFDKGETDTWPSEQELADARPPRAPKPMLL